MATADRLVELMYSWMDERRECAEKLRDLAGELESLREKCNGFEAVGNSISVVGAGCMIGAGLTFVTGGVAAIFLGTVGAAYSTIGALTTVATIIIEGWSSSKTMKEAEKAYNCAKDNAQEIDQLFVKLKVECTSGTAQELHAMKEILGALCRRCGLSESDINMDLLLNERLSLGMPGFTISDGQGFDGVVKNLFVGICSAFAFIFENKALAKLLTKGTEKLAKQIAAKAMKTGLKRLTRLTGGVLGLAFSLPDAIDNWKDQIKKNHVTEASQSMRDNSKAILVVVDDLQEKLNSICNEFKELKEVKECIENSDKCSREALLRYAIKNCQDPQVKTWLEDGAKRGVFLRLVDVFQMVKTELDKELKKKKGKEIDITFVAHGGISEPLMPASLLMPLPTITDVVLYSPWNCVINAKVAYGIAAGTIEPKHRVFGCLEPKKCPKAARHNHTPSCLPIRWNKMRDAQKEAIPNIMVQSLMAPKDDAWKYFMYLKDNKGLPDHGRVVIPFILPDNEKIKVPFVVVTLALALVLFFSQIKARVHLAACLGKYPPNTKLPEQDLIQQYAYTIDYTSMSTTDEVYPTAANLRLFQNLKAIFG